MALLLLAALAIAFARFRGSNPLDAASLGGVAAGPGRSGGPVLTYAWSKTNEISELRGLVRGIE